MAKRTKVILLILAALTLVLWLRSRKTIAGGVAGGASGPGTEPPQGYHWEREQSGLDAGPWRLVKNDSATNLLDQLMGQSYYQPESGFIN